MFELCVFLHVGFKIIKFIIDDPTPINAADRGILELNAAVHNLHAQIDGLHNKIDELRFRLAFVAQSLTEAFYLDARRRLLLL